MIDGLAVLVEAAGAIGHQPLALGFADFPAQVGFAGQAEFALATFGGIQGNNVIADGNAGNAFTNRLYNAAAFMAKDWRKVALGILTREGNASVWYTPVAITFIRTSPAFGASRPPLQPTVADPGPRQLLLLI